MAPSEEYNGNITLHYKMIPVYNLIKYNIFPLKLAHYDKTDDIWE